MVSGEVAAAGRAGSGSCVGASAGSGTASKTAVACTGVSAARTDASAGSCKDAGTGDDFGRGRSPAFGEVEGLDAPAVIVLQRQGKKGRGV